MQLKYEEKYKEKIKDYISRYAKFEHVGQNFGSQQKETSQGEGAPSKANVNGKVNCNKGQQNESESNNKKPADNLSETSLNKGEDSDDDISEGDLLGDEMDDDLNEEDNEENGQVEIIQPKPIG